MIESAEDRVQRVVARHLGVPPEDIAPSARVEGDLGLDPLDLVLIGLRLEELEEREFPVAQLEAVVTVSDLTAIVTQMREGNGERDLAHSMRVRIAKPSSRPRRAVA
jgi:acyl carrier protein